MKINKIKGMNFHSINKEELISELKKDIDNYKLYQYISITNSEATYIGNKVRDHYNYINNAKFSLCDGIGIN